MTTFPIYRLAPLLWLAFSVVLHVVGTHVHALLAHIRWRDTTGKVIRHPVVRLAAPALYYLGIPYLALIQGALLPRLLGLSDLQWINDIGLGVAFGLGAMALIALVFGHAYANITTVESRSEVEGMMDDAPRRPMWSSVLWDVILIQSHWMFYRAALAQAIGDIYWGAFASLIPLAIENALDPAFRRRLLHGETGPRKSARLAFAFTTTVLYIFMRNFPLLVTVHWLGEMALMTVLPWARTKGKASEVSETSEALKEI